ncbi:MAG: HU family DNA-binding protein [Planctomycetes bacterium]|nr:HU family DNA-binding protein [Planctomycetota bacterium]
MATVSKRDLVLRIAARVGQSKAVTGDVIQSFLDEVIDELARGNRLEFREFGVFEVKTRAARKARNPQNGEPVQIAARTVVRFKAGRKMKATVRADSATPAPSAT